jgi:transcriptional regulator with XRE-family HTH domain
MPTRPLTGTPNLGNRIRHLREARKLNASQLARIAGISRQTVAKIECGISGDIKLGQAIAVAEALGISLDVLCDITLPIQAVLIAEEIVAAKQALREIFA